MSSPPGSGSRFFWQMFWMSVVILAFIWSIVYFHSKSKPQHHGAPAHQVISQY